jgi:hypothetical protein
MVNYQIFPLCNLLSQLINEEAFFQAAAVHALENGIQNNNNDMSPHLVPDAQKERLAGMLKFATHCADRLELQAAHDRIDIFSGKMRYKFSLHECAIELRTLREAFQSGIHYICFFHYKKEKVALLQRVDADWADVLNRFSQSRDDIKAAVDCYALEHHSASVFHLMLIMEKAVQAFGKKLRVDIVKTNPGKRVSELTWESILNAIQPKIKGNASGYAFQKKKA